LLKHNTIQQPQKKMKSIKTLLFVLVLLAFAGASYSQTDTNNVVKKKVSSIKKVYKSYKNCKKSNDCTYFNLSYQVVNSGKAKSIINKAIQDSLLSAVNFWPDMNATTFKQAASNFIAEYDSSLSQQNNGAPWMMDTKARVNSNGKNVLSYSVDQVIYTGGAHPNSYVTYYNFDKATGNQLTLKDVLGSGFETALNKVIDADFRKMKGLSATDNLQEKAYLFENKITYTTNFAVEKKGLRFFYNNYEIAPYATGQTNLFIPWKDLSGILPDASYYK